MLSLNNWERNETFNVVKFVQFANVERTIVNIYIQTEQSWRIDTVQ